MDEGSNPDKKRETGGATENFAVRMGKTALGGLVGETSGMLLI
jgi:hypothetical protein